jgi:hypothetical protein
MALRPRALAIEGLESRRMLSTVPLFKTYLESDAGGDFAGMMDIPTVMGAATLSVAAMQRTVVAATLPASDQGDVFKLALDAGQLLTLSVQAPSAAQSPMKLVVADPTGKVVAKNTGATIDPETGAAMTGLALSYRAPTAGVYHVGLFNEDPATVPAARSYALAARPIGLSAAMLDNAALNFDKGGMYAHLQGGRLQIIGPTGYGFELGGKWTKTILVQGDVNVQTYTATGGVTLPTPWGQLPVPLPKGTAIIVTTKPNGWGGAFGEIDRTRFVTGLAWLDQIADAVNGQVGLALNLPDDATSLDVLQGVEVGLALGSTITSSIDINAPLNPAIPYFYFVASAGVSASFGNISVAGEQWRLSVIVDPRDSLYVGVNIPVPILGANVPSLGVGFSRKGLIPFKPAVKPTKYDPAAMTLRGHFYALGEVNIPIPDVPVLQINVGGSVVLNFDANGDGGLLTYILDDAPKDLSELFAGKSLLPAFENLANALLTNFAFGVNGKAGLTVSTPTGFRPALSATFTLAKGTYIATGTNNPKVFFRGEFTDNLLRGTFLEQYMQYVRPTQTIILDGAAEPGMLMASFEALYEYFGFSASAKHMILGTNLNVPGMATFTTTVEAKISLLGAANVMFTGVINPDGTFRLDGKSDVTIAGFMMAQADLTLTKDGLSVRGTLNLGTLGSAMMTGNITAAGNFSLTGSMMTNFGLGAAAPNLNADLTLSNAGLKAKTTVTFLGQTAMIEGMIQPNLDFSLTGTANIAFSTFIQDVSTDMTVTLARVNGVPEFKGSFQARLLQTQAVWNPFADGGYSYVTVYDLLLTAEFALAYPLTYSGSASVSGSSSLWPLPINASGSVMNGGLSIDIFPGTTLTLPLPF